MGKVLEAKQILNISVVHEMFNKMQNVQSTFKQSGGSHAAAAFDKKGTLLSSHEDIGRHNAVDKVIGDLIVSETLEEAACITVSGRNFL